MRLGVDPAPQSDVATPMFSFPISRHVCAANRSSCAKTRDSSPTGETRLHSGPVNLHVSIRERTARVKENNA